MIFRISELANSFPNLDTMVLPRFSKMMYNQAKHWVSHSINMFGNGPTLYVMFSGLGGIPPITGSCKQKQSLIMLNPSGVVVAVNANKLTSLGIMLCSSPNWENAFQKSLPLYKIKIVFKKE